MITPLLLLTLLSCTSEKVDDEDGGSAPGPRDDTTTDDGAGGTDGAAWCSGEAARTEDGRAFDTVWDAVDAAGEGERVEVCPGTWTGRVEISRSIVLVGDGDGATVLDGGGEGSTISVTGGEEVVLRQLTLTGGSGTDDGDAQPWGGGLLVVNTTYLELHDLVITGNSAHGGGGAWLQGLSSGVYVDGVRFLDNSATLFAGGLGIVASDGATLVDLELSGNTAEHGGGIGVSDLEELQLFGSRLAENTADHGGGLYVEFTGELQIDEGTFEDNEGRLAGGGMLVQEVRDVSVDDSAFEGNSSSEGAGAGAFFGDNDLVELDDCSFSGGTAHHEAGLAFNTDWGDGGGTAALDGVEVSGNEAETYGGGLTTWGLDLLTVVDSTLRSNTALDGAGGGLFVGNVAAARVTATQLMANDATTTGGGGWLQNSLLDADTVDAQDNSPDDIATPAGSFSLEGGDLGCDASGACG